MRSPPAGPVGRESGQVELAGAVLVAAEGRPDEAEAGFAVALAILEEKRLLVDRADPPRQWGRALAAVGERATAAEKLERAFELYREHGAAAAWSDRIAADLRPLAG